MGSVYKRGKRWYIQFKDEEGAWLTRSAADTKVEALAILKAVERKLHGAPGGVPALPANQEAAAQPAHLEAPARGVSEAAKSPRSVEAPKTSSPPQVTATLKEKAEQWMERRKTKGLRNWANDRTHFVHHIYPVLAAMQIPEIRVRHVRDLVEQLEGKGLAPRTILKVYGTLHKFFTDLMVDEVVQHTPCVLTKDQLPKSRDKDPEWRATAVFTREEVELIVSAPGIPEDRQMLYTLLFLTGSRFGEVAGLKWSDLDLRMSPLARLRVSRSYEHGTKTDQPRQVPVHPLLLELLMEWRTGGFVEIVGRAARPGDLIVPSRELAMRSRHHTRNKFLEDIKKLGLRHRRVHDSRRTLITLARVDGARKDVLEQITHGARGNILDMYTTLPWPTLCEAIQCLRLKRLNGEECMQRMAEMARWNAESNGQGETGQENEFTAGFTVDSENRLTDSEQALNQSGDSLEKTKWRRRELNVPEILQKRVLTA